MNRINILDSKRYLAFKAEVAEMREAALAAMAASEGQEDPNNPNNNNNNNNGSASPTMTANGTDKDKEKEKEKEKKQKAKVKKVKDPTDKPRKMCLKLLKDRNGNELFRAFLENIYASESIDFWNAVEIFRKVSLENPAKLHGRAMAIFEQYLLKHIYKFYFICVCFTIILFVIFFDETKIFGCRKCKRDQCGQ